MITETTLPTGTRSGVCPKSALRKRRLGEHAGAEAELALECEAKEDMLIAGWHGHSSVIHDEHGIAPGRWEGGNCAEAGRRSGWTVAALQVCELGRGR